MPNPNPVCAEYVNAYNLENVKCTYTHRQEHTYTGNGVDVLSTIHALLCEMEL